MVLGPSSYPLHPALHPGVAQGDQYRERGEKVPPLMDRGRPQRAMPRVSEWQRVVNVGGGLQRILNNHFRATRHRVVYSPWERISIPFFLEAEFDASLACAPASVARSTRRHAAASPTPTQRHTPRPHGSAAPLPATSPGQTSQHATGAAAPTAVQPPMPPGPPPKGGLLRLSPLQEQARMGPGEQGWLSRVQNERPFSHLV